jgi:hypothetical protein
VKKPDAAVSAVERLSLIMGVVSTLTIRFLFINLRERQRLIEFPTWKRFVVPAIQELTGCGERRILFSFLYRFDKTNHSIEPASAGFLLPTTEEKHGKKAVPTRYGCLLRGAG